MGRIGNRISRLVNSKTEKDEQNQSSDNDLSPEKEPPKRVKPRLGSQYQTKVAKFEHSQSDEVTKRQLPDLMSMDYPHITEHEAQKSGEDLNGEFVSTLKLQQAILGNFNDEFHRDHVAANRMEKIYRFSASEMVFALLMAQRFALHA